MKMDYKDLCPYCMEEKGGREVCPSCGYSEPGSEGPSIFLPPRTVLYDKYLIGRVLGQGGFGITYLAWDINLDIKIAVKEFFPQGLVSRGPTSKDVVSFSGDVRKQFEFGLERFLHEARTLARFADHPNIVTVRDFFRANGTAYMVMNYIEGMTLEAYLEKEGGKISFKETREIMMPVIDALKEVHKAGIMHRDISPDNIFIDCAGRVILIDFGAARQEMQQKSRGLSVVLKAGYAPEEQYRTRGEQGPWTDVYAAAATMYRAITGQVPMESMDRLAEDLLDLPSELDADIETHQEKLLLKAMALRAAERYKTMEEFQRELISGEVIEEKTIGVMPQKEKVATTGDISTEKAPKKSIFALNKRIGGIVAVTVIAILLVLGIMTMFAEDKEQPFAEDGDVAIIEDEESSIADDEEPLEELVLSGIDQDLTVAIGAEPQSFDPLQMASSPEITIAEHMVESLLYITEEGILKPALAEAWEPAADGLSWVFNLRQGVDFHDGEPFNAEAVKYNLDRFMAKGAFGGEKAAIFSFLLDEVNDVKIVDEYTIELHLKREFAPIIYHLASPFIGMHSPTSLEALGSGQYVEKPVGTGPFQYGAWEQGKQVVLEKNEDYWGGAPILDSVTFQFVAESGARAEMLEAGEVEVIMAVHPGEIERLDAEESIKVVSGSSVRVLKIGYNLNHDLFENVKVRRALNYAIDKEEIIKNIFQGVGSPSSAPIVPAIFGHTEAGPYEYNPEKALELLAAAGLDDGFEFELYHSTGRYPEDDILAKTVQTMLAEVGVTANLTTYDWATYLEKILVPPEMAEHDAYMLGWGTITMEANYGLYPLFHSTQWPTQEAWYNNVSYYANAEVDELLAEARATTDLDARENLYKQAIKIIWDDAPWIFLIDEGYVNAVRSNVKGLIYHPLEKITVWDAYIE